MKTQTERQINTKVNNWLTSHSHTCPKKLIDRIVEIIRGVEQGMMRLTGAAKRYVETIDGDPALQPVFPSASEFIPERVWAILDQIGRGKLDARLACASPELIRKVSKVPAAKQRDLIKDGVDVLTYKGVKKITLPKLNQYQLAMVFDSGRIVPPSEQKLPVQPVKADEPRYKLMKSCVRVYRDDGRVAFEISRAAVMKGMDLHNKKD